MTQDLDTAAEEYTLARKIESYLARECILPSISSSEATARGYVRITRRIGTYSHKSAEIISHAKTSIGERAIVAMDCMHWANKKRFLLSVWRK